MSNRMGTRDSSVESGRLAPDAGDRDPQRNAPEVVDFSSSLLTGLGGRGRFIDRLTPFQNVSTLRSTSWRPCTRYSRIALSHCSPALATSFSQSPRAVSSGASVTPSQIVTFG